MVHFLAHAGELQGQGGKDQAPANVLVAPREHTPQTRPPQDGNGAQFAWLKALSSGSIWSS